MHLDRDPHDPRVHQRDRIRHTLGELIENLERDCPPRLVLGALVDAARRLHLKLEGDDPIARPRRGRAAP